jgi:hypothetical protein
MPEALKQLDSEDVNYDKLLQQAKQRDSEWKRFGQPERTDLIRAMLQRVIVCDGALEIQLNLESTVQMLLGKPAHLEHGAGNVQTFSPKTSFRHIAQGKSLKLVIGNERSASSASREAIAKAIFRARAWYDLIVQGKASGLYDLANQHDLTHRYVKNIFPLAFLSPESVEFLLNDSDGRMRTLD